MTPAKSPLAIKPRFTFTAIAVILLAGSAVYAQPTPTPTPAPGPETPPVPPDGTGAVPVPVPAPVPVPVPVEPPPPEPKKDEPPAIAVKYDKGIVFETEDGEFEGKLSLRTQFRLEITRPTEKGAEFENHFVIPRGRLQLEGHVFGKDTRYKLEAGLEERGSFSFVKDLWVEQKVGNLVIRGGQWKRPFNRQELVSDFASELNERAITADFVGGGRDLGVAVHNDYEKSPEGIEWAVGVFNRFSGGVDRPSLTTTCTQDPVTLKITCAVGVPSNVAADDVGPAVVAHIGWNKGKIKGYSEGDLEGGPMRIAVGASYKIDLADGKSLGGSKTDNWSHGAEVDALLKNNGFDLLVGVYLMKIKTAKVGLGALVQAGYFLTPKKIQVAGRFALVRDKDNFDGAGAPVSGKRMDIEARGALNYYIRGHQWKIATDAGIVVTTGHDNAGVSDKPDIQIRSMAQMTF